MKIQLAFIILVFLFTFKVNGHEKQNAILPNDVVIEGEIIDDLLALTPEKEVELVLYISSFSSNARFSPGEKEHRIITKYNTHFKLIIPAPSGRLFFYIGFRAPNPFKFWSGTDNIYILEKGDRIKCKLSSDFFEFSGKGSEKLNCQSEIYKLQYFRTKSEVKYLLEKKWEEEIAYSSKKRDSVLKLRIATVERYSPQLGIEIKEILIANCYGLRYFSWFYEQVHYINEKDRFRAFLNSSEFKNADLSLLKKYKMNILVASPNFCDFIFMDIVLNNVRFENGVIQKGGYRRELDDINENYTGQLRDKLLTIFFLYHKKAPNEFLEEALRLVETKYYKEILLQIKERKANGLPFFPFELENDKGEMVKLEDFKDKVVVMDFWYTGCLYCVQLNKKMEPVFEHFKNNSFVNFVSVSTDKSKPMWLNSLSRGKYTHPISINLNASPKTVGERNPLIERYNIKSYPTLMILKNGKMYDSSPPRTNEELIKVIDLALLNM